MNYDNAEHDWEEEFGYMGNELLDVCALHVMGAVIGVALQGGAYDPQAKIGDDDAPWDDIPELDDAYRVMEALHRAGVLNRGILRSHLERVDAVTPVPHPR